MKWLLLTKIFSGEGDYQVAIFLELKYISSFIMKLSQNSIMITLSQTLWATSKFDKTP